MEILQSLLFENITEGELEDMKACRCLRTISRPKDSLIFRRGQQVREIGLLLSGSAQIERLDLWGNLTLLDTLQAGDIFAETYAITGQPLMVDVRCTGDCSVLLLNVPLLTDSCHHSTSWCHKMMQNMLTLSTHKSLVLSRRIFCTSPKTIRGRLFTYLSGEAVRAGSSTFRIPFNRQQLADYLNLDRSALSKELGRMRDEGLLDFRKNEFTLHTTMDE